MKMGLIGKREKRGEKENLGKRGEDEIEKKKNLVRN